MGFTYCFWQDICSFPLVSFSNQTAFGQMALGLTKNCCCYSFYVKIYFRFRFYHPRRIPNLTPQNWFETCDPRYALHEQKKSSLFFTHDWLTRQSITQKGTTIQAKDLWIPVPKSISHCVNNNIHRGDVAVELMAKISISQKKRSQKAAHRSKRASMRQMPSESRPWTTNRWRSWWIIPAH